MTGGILQIAVCGQQDIFLTGSPQITFFKVLYRRYTNFSIESIPQYFINPMNFDQEASSVIDKIGDLMNRIYLEIDLPKINLIKNPSHWKINLTETKNNFLKAQKLYHQIYDYIQENTNLIRQLHSLAKTDNISLCNIEEIMRNQHFIKKLITLRNSINLDQMEPTLKFKLIQQINKFDIQFVFASSIHKRNLSEEDDYHRKLNLLHVIEHNLYPKMKDFYLEIYHQYISEQKKYQSLINGTYSERYQFAWVEEIGHAIIDQIEFKIGNRIIDSHTGDWMILFDKLFSNPHQMTNYHKMIGNIKELTVFNDQAKNSYKLIIPLQFWFCRHTGLSLPLVALHYHDIIVSVKLKHLSKVSFFENDPQLSDISNLQARYDINIQNAKLYVDYIFLDSEERKRFAQSTHEYLIEVIQHNQFSDVNGKQYGMHLTFNHPTKFIVWFVQPNSYRENPDGTQSCQWNNFGQPIENASLHINGYDRLDKQIDIKFFNYVQPYLHFKNSPPDGIYVFSFSINPTEHQPSGSINLSRIDDFSLNIIFSENFVKMNDNGAHIGVYVMSYNILRIMGGMAGLAFE